MPPKRRVEKGRLRGARPSTPAALQVASHWWRAVAAAASGAPPPPSALAARVGCTGYYPRQQSAQNALAQAGQVQVACPLARAGKRGQAGLQGCCRTCHAAGVQGQARAVPAERCQAARAM